MADIDKKFIESCKAIGGDYSEQKIEQEGGFAGHRCTKGDIKFLLNRQKEGSGRRFGEISDGAIEHKKHGFLLLPQVKEIRYEPPIGDKKWFQFEFQSKLLATKRGAISTLVFSGNEKEGKVELNVYDIFIGGEIEY